MVSICTCSMNAKWEAQTFIDALYRHNSTDFEVVLIHDNRVDDGAGLVFEDLKKKYGIRVIESTHADAWDYMDEMLSWYRKTRTFPAAFISFLQRNLEMYKEGTLYKPSERFFWLPSGWLYNKAIRAAKGDLLVVMPADYMLLFHLEDLDEEVQRRSLDGVFYGKMNGLPRVIANAPIQEIVAYLKEYEGQTEPPQMQKLRQFMRYPSKLKNVYIPDTKTGEVCCVNDPQFVEQMRKWNESAQDLRLSVHGLHVMTRKAYEKIGGFSEEFYGRAWSDDKMTAMGLETCRDPNIQWQLPKRFSFAWTPRSTFPKTPSREEVLKVDPWADKYQPIGNPAIYLDTGFRDVPNAERIISSNLFDHHAERVVPSQVFNRCKEVILFEQA